MVFSQKLVKRYKELQGEVPDCLLLMQVGAFMQVADKRHPEAKTPVLSRR